MDQLEIAMYVREQHIKRKKEEEAEKAKKMAEHGIVPEKKKEQYDSVYTLEEGEALALYIVVMAVGTIFTDRWWIWIGATVAYYCFRTRHKRRKHK